MSDTEIQAAQIVWYPHVYWFASLDGQEWIEVGDDPRPKRLTV